MQEKILTLGIIFLLLSSTVLAQEVSGGIARDHPLYFFDRLVESLQLTFTFAPEEKAKLKLKFAEERLAEANDLAKRGKSDLAVQTIEDYKDEMEDMRTFGAQITNLAKKRELDMLVANATTVHLEVLMNVLEKVPDEAKSAIEKAMEVSAQGNKEAIEALKKSGGVPTEIPKAPEKLPEEIKRQLPEETKPAGGIPTEEEIPTTTTTIPGERGKVSIKITDPGIPTLQDVPTTTTPEIPTTTIPEISLPEIPEDVATVEITLGKIEFHHKEMGWVVVHDQQKTYDLVRLKKQNATEEITQVEVPAGYYDKIRVYLPQVKITLNLPTGETKEITPKMPQEYVEISVEFKVAVGKLTNVTLDFDAASDLQKKGVGDYDFQPIVEGRIEEPEE